MKTLRLLAACGLLILLGCQNPLQRPPDMSGEDAGGTLLLSINRPGARTILPGFNFGLDDFDQFELVFVNTSDPLDILEETLPREDLVDGVFTLPLPEGTWYLTVTAFLPGEVAAAVSTLSAPVEILPGELARAEVALFPIDDGDDPGTFAWDIRFPGIENALRLCLQGWKWPIGTTPDFGANPVFYYDFDVTDDSVTSWDSSLAGLNAGQYYVVFTLYRQAGAVEESARTSAILRIASNLTSRFEGTDATFTPADFPSYQTSLLSLILGAWNNPQPYEWNFAYHGIEPGHFGVLGITGITGNDFHADGETGIIYWLNLAALEMGVPTDLDELQDMIDFAREWMPNVTDTLAAQLAALREQSEDVNLVWIHDTESITSSAASLEVFAGRNITITLKNIGDNIHTIQLDGTGSLFTIPAGVTLELRNVTLSGVRDNTAPLVIVSQGGNLVMNAGARITGNYNTFVPGTGGVWDLLGGGVRVEGTFDMADGVISGNRSYDEAGDSGGGGVFVYGSSGDFTMSGGEIFGNRAGNWGGGGVFVGGGGSFYLSSGTIEDNEASGGGGGVHVGAHDVGYGTFTMSGGTITLNTTTAGAGGGGVFVNRAPDDGTGRGRFCMTGGVIYDNYATGDTNGGGVFVDGYFEMTGGTIEANEAGGWGGGGVFVSHGAFTMNHVAAIITGNRANNGGGVSIGANGTFILKNGTIKDHNTEIDGGGVFVGRDGSFTMRGGRIEDNMSFRGGGVHVADYGTFEISGGVVFGMDAESLTPPGTPNVAEIGASIYVGQLATAAYAGDLANLGIIETSNHTLPHGAITGVTLSVNGGTPRRYNNLGSVFDSITEIPGDYTITLFEPQYLASWILNPGQNITLLGWNEESGMLTHNGATDLSMFIIQNARLTLGNNITLRGRPAGTPAGAVPSIIVGTSGTLTMLEGSVISGHNTTGFISPISIDGGNARLDIQGGTITGNSNVNQSFAHAAVILNNGVLTMSGGSITGNNTHAPGESADVFMSVNPAVTATLSDTAEIGVIRLSPSDAPDPGGTTRVAIGASWTGSIGRIDLAHNVATLADVAERWNGRMVLSGAGLTASNVTRVALGYFVPGTTPANSQPITGHVIGTAGANLGRLVPSL